MCFSVEVDKDIKKIAKRFNSEIAIGEFHYLKDLQTLHNNKKFKTPEADGIIYPNYFAPVIRFSQEKRRIHPMRYRVRPNGSKSEIPSKYNVFNARIDSLEKRDTWKNIFMRQHGLFPFKRFYEHVPKGNKTGLISFYPKGFDIMWAPCLWDYWESEDKKTKFYSFALITKEAPQEIEEMGHDRCPIFLEEDLIDIWLEPHKHNKKDIYDALRHIHKPVYQYSWV